MAFVSSPDRLPPNITSAKIVVAGGFGVAKTTTTVAMDFGRITLAGDLILYLFGAARQPG